MITNKRILFLTIIFFGVLFFFYVRNQNAKITKDQDPRGKLYAGSYACINCHQSIYSSHLHTAHFLATRPSSLSSMQDLLKNSREFIVSDSQRVIIEEHDTSLYQASYTNGKKMEMQRFDITFGGVKGETYLYWNESRLFQLPISYSNIAHRLTSSPGPTYQANKIDFSRYIGQKCPVTPLLSLRWIRTTQTQTILRVLMYTVIKFSY